MYIYAYTHTHRNGAILLGVTSKLNLLIVRYTSIEIDRWMDR